MAHGENCPPGCVEGCAVKQANRCAGWSARDVVSHIVSMHGYMLQLVGRGLDGAPSVLADPLAAFKAARARAEVRPT